MVATVRYTSSDEDSARWARFVFREGDVVVSTRSKSGTTWVQQVVASLLHGTPDLPAPLATLSPWVDWLVEPVDEVVARLEAQPGRRVVKTHTPLDGLPRDPRATSVVVCRHPLDAAVSLYHQGGNLDRARMRELTGDTSPVREPRPRPPLHDWLAGWAEEVRDPRAAMDSLDGFLHHARVAWARRDDADTVLVHYADLLADREGEMRRLAERLGIEVEPSAWPALVDAASFDAMRSRAGETAPDPSGVLLDQRAFFRRGTSGAGSEVLTADELVRYRARSAAALPSALDAWLHR
ncbi:MAG: sulfotransferase domain-containing protein [Nocardioidaceae bacterium]|nr:sulfotransferase domain-containing protein [Nocardioidaceae bacterium]